MPSRFLMRVTRLATLTLLFCHVGQWTISILIPVPYLLSAECKI
jgi:hypothetical protein